MIMPIMPIGSLILGIFLNKTENSADLSYLEPR